MSKAEKKAKIEKARKLVSEIAVLKDEIAKLRDQMRAKISDTEDILESLEEAHDEFETGIRSLNSGLDQASQYL
jgi:predicted  nucleic acid-binding Zn-ribbon protein